MINVLAIVQARMGSTRLPNKLMLNLHGYPVVEWVYRRVMKAKNIDKVIFAIPDAATDDVLQDYLRSMGAEVYRGSEFDLVDRFYQVIKTYPAKSIVRICADNPLISPTEIELAVDYFRKNQCDYAFNHVPKDGGWPDGLGAEISSISVINLIHRFAKDDSQREHVFNYVWDHQNDFTIRSIPVPKELSYPKLKFDIDTYDDYENLISMPLDISFSSKQVIECALKNNKIRK